MFKITKIFVFSLLVVALAAPAFATTSRVQALGGPARYINDDSDIFRWYGTLPSYRAMLDREGLDSPGDVALAGDESTLRAELGRLRDAGVTDFGASLFPADEGAPARTLEFLKSEF